MKKLLVIWGFALTVLLSPLAMAKFDEGHEYALIGSQPPVEKNAQIEVVEFFWYSCPHCFSFEPYINQWKANKPEEIKFTRIPATFNPPAKLHAQVYYALDLMGEAERLLAPMFEAIHKQGNKLATEEAIEGFLKQQGVNLETYRKAMKSFAVQTRVRQAESLFRKYGLRGVPAVVVNGRYRSADVKNYRELVEVIDYMIQLVKEEQAAAQ